MKYAKTYKISLSLIISLFVCSASVHSQAQTITLQSREGKKISINKEAAFLSKLIQNLHHDFFAEKESPTIRISKLNQHSLAIAVKYLNIAFQEYRKEDPGFITSVAVNRTELQPKVINALSIALNDGLKKENEPIHQIVALIGIVNYLDFPELVEAAYNEASKQLSWENIRNKHWHTLPVEMVNKITQWIVKKNWDVFFPIELSPAFMLPGEVAIISKDEKIIVTPSENNTAKVWGARNGRLIHTLEGHTSPIAAIDFSQDETKIVTHSEDNSAKVWDRNTGKLIYTLYQDVNPKRTIAHPERSKIFKVVGKETQVISALDGPISLTIENLFSDLMPAELLSKDKGKTMLVLKNEPEKIMILDAKNGTILHAIPEQNANEADFSFSPDSSQIVIRSKNNQVRVLNSLNAKVLFTLGQSDDEAQFSPDSKKILTHQNDTVHIWNAFDGTKIYSFKAFTNAKIDDASWSSNGAKIITSSFIMGTKVWNASNGNLLFEIKGYEGTLSALSPDGTKLLSVAHPDLKLWDAENRKLLAILKLPDKARIGLEWSSQGNIIIGNLGDDIWDDIHAIFDLSSKSLKDYLNGNQLSYSQTLLITWIKKHYKEGKPMYWGHIKGPHITTKKLKAIFKTFHPQIQQSLIKRYDIQEEPPEEILEEGIEQLGL